MEHTHFIKIFISMECFIMDPSAWIWILRPSGPPGVTWPRRCPAVPRGQPRGSIRTLKSKINACSVSWLPGVIWNVVTFIGFSMLCSCRTVAQNKMVSEPAGSSFNSSLFRLFLVPEKTTAIKALFAFKLLLRWTSLILRAKSKCLDKSNRAKLDEVRVELT